MFKGGRWAGMASMVALAACADSGNIVGVEAAPDRIVVVNDAAVLSARVRQANSLPLALDHVVSADAAAVAALGLTLVAEVDAPVLDGVTLQATHVGMNAGGVFVSYNVQGPLYRGGVDVFSVDLASGVGVPVLESQALFRDTDVSSLAPTGDVVYLATATGSEGFTSPAVLEVLEHEGGKLTANSVRLDLPSFAGTDVTYDDGDVYVTSGTGGPAQGGLSVFDRASLSLVSFDPFLDARAVDVRPGNIIVMRGSPGALRVYGEGGIGPASVMEIGGATIPESKATVQLTGGLAFVSAGEEGLYVVNLADGAVLEAVPVPTVEGVDLADQVTNAVSVHDDLVFVANGGAGLWVYQAVADLQQQPAVAPNLQLIGRVVFPDGPSVNYVWGSEAMLFVASGLGGLKVVEIGKLTEAPVAP